MDMISVKECVLLIVFILFSGAEGNPHHYTPSAAPPLATHFACQSDPCLHGLCIDHSANRYTHSVRMCFYSFLWLTFDFDENISAITTAIPLFPLLWLFDGLVSHHQHVLVLLRGGLYGLPMSNGLERVLVRALPSRGNVYRWNRTVPMPLPARIYRSLCFG